MLFVFDCANVKHFFYNKTQNVKKMSFDTQVYTCFNYLFLSGRRLLTAAPACHISLSRNSLSSASSFSR